ncbi:hypothetical protein LQ318_07095 [Aliifodinibius salicampi]|uniref:DUF378 domain-containing protein n=1 Tax=Fodinibius salicampi TaxID=1920655 RepID=A0ABT3PY11_9BACT|nr:hypothetical protein [Fodinibius salicampi]
MSKQKETEGDTAAKVILAVVMIVIWGSCGGIDAVFNGESTFWQGFRFEAVLSVGLVILGFLIYSIISSTN